MICDQNLKKMNQMINYYLRLLNFELNLKFLFITIFLSSISYHHHLIIVVYFISIYFINHILNHYFYFQLYLVINLIKYHKHLINLNFHQKIYFMSYCVVQLIIHVSKIYIYYFNLFIEFQKNYFKRFMKIQIIYLTNSFFCLYYLIMNYYNWINLLFFILLKQN